MEKELFSLLLTMKGGLLKLNYCCMGRESWHAITKLFNLQFRYSAISYVIGFSLLPGVVIVMNLLLCMTQYKDILLLFYCVSPLEKAVVCF